MGLRVQRKGDAAAVERELRQRRAWTFGQQRVGRRQCRRLVPDERHDREVGDCRNHHGAGHDGTASLGNSCEQRADCEDRQQRQAQHDHQAEP